MRSPSLMLSAVCLAVCLAACGGGREAAQPAPSPSLPAETPAPASPAPTPEPAPSPTPAPLWWEGVAAEDLPTDRCSAADIAAAEQAFYLLAEMEERDIALYGANTPELEGYAGVLLRQGDTLTPFDQRYLAEEQPALPELWWGDFGGGEALAVRYLVANSGQDLTYELHLYAPETDGGWTDAGLTGPELETLLSAQVAYGYQAETRTVTASLPGWNVSCRLGPQDPAPAGLTFQGRTFYRLEDGRFTGVYGVGVRFSDGEAPRYFASVTARIGCEGERLTLSELRLTEIGGV